MPKSMTDDVRFKSKGVTDRDEGKKPVGIISEKPLLSLLSLPVRLPVRFKLFVKAEEGIFEHPIHQRGLWAHLGEADVVVEELFRLHPDIGRPLIPGGPVGRHRMWRSGAVSADACRVHIVLNSNVRRYQGQ